MKKKIAAFVLVAALSSSCALFAGCNDNNAGKQPIEPPKQEAQVVRNKYIVQEGITDYYLVLPKDAKEEESFAALEFNYFMNMATGCTFETIDESEVKSNYKYISLGKTEQFEEAFPDADLSPLFGTNSSYFIATKGNNIYVVAGDEFKGDGCLYGTYDLLNDLIGYTYYHDTEIYVEEKQTVNLLEYEAQIVTPSFDIRCVSTYYNYCNDTHNTRLKFMNFSRGWELNRECFGHGTIQKYLDPTKIAPNSGGQTWGRLHPDWFVYPDIGDIDPNATEMIQNQLCMTGDQTGLDDVIAERLIEFLTADEESKYFMFGQEDNKFMCTCDRCQAATLEYGGTAGGLQVAFMNKVVEKVEAWVEENQPGREVEYIVYAYHPTEEAPTKVVNGKTVPYSDQVIPHEKLRVMLCPIQSNYAYSFDSPVNSSFMRALEEWSTVAAGKIFIYGYDLNMYYYFTHFNNFGTAASMYKTCMDYGVRMYIAQGVSDTNIGCLDEMRSYVESALLWDVSLNYDVLAYDFMQHFYKDASEYVWDYYQEIRDRYAYYQTVVAPQSGTISGGINSSELYTYEFTQKLASHLTKAFEAIEPLKASDPQTYTTLYNRLKKEWLTIIYVRVELYKEFFNDAEIAEMKTDWDFYTNYFGITKGGEGNALPDIFA
jgi:hypothetical protein